jgi:Tripartite tricarboxylate transporter family receptor
LIIRVFSDPVPALPLTREGKLRPFGVATKTRFAFAPEIPPIAEAGVPDFDAVVWTMFVAAAHTPKEIASRLHAELSSIVGLPEIQQQIVKIGMSPLRVPRPRSCSDSSTPRSFAGARSCSRPGSRDRNSTTCLDAMRRLV